MMVNECKTANDESTNLELPVIIWNKNQILKWSDFKKRVDLRVKASAISAIGFKSDLLVEHIKNGSKFKFKIREMDLCAIFIPHLSWVIKNISKKKKKSLLKHEQGHFDLAEEITRGAKNKIIDNFQNKVFDVKTKNEDDAKKEAIVQATKFRTEIEHKLQKELELQETKYDNMTDHGLTTKHQKRYDERFKKLRE